MIRILKPKWKEHIDIDFETGEVVSFYMARLSYGFIKIGKGVFFGSVTCVDQGLLNGEEEPSGVLKWRWDITLYSRKRGERLFTSEDFFYSPEWAKRDLELFWKGHKT